VVVMTQWRDGSRTEKEGLGQEKLRWRSGRSLALFIGWRRERRQWPVRCNGRQQWDLNHSMVLV
jgi:hypothetical protein